MQEVAQADTEMQTEYAICYCKNRADSAMVIRVRKALAAAKPELLLDSSYFVPWLLPGKARLFTPVSYTERPAVAAAKICEGKIVVLVNGSPSAMVLPALFCENFECLDDYASTAVFSSFLRILKYVSFYLTVFLPGVFVCLAVYLPELIHRSFCTRSKRRRRPHRCRCLRKCCWSYSFWRSSGKQVCGCRSRWDIRSVWCPR